LAASASVISCAAWLVAGVVAGVAVGVRAAVAGKVRLGLAVEGDAGAAATRGLAVALAQAATRPIATTAIARFRTVEDTPT